MLSAYWLPVLLTAVTAASSGSCGKALYVSKTVTGSLHDGASWGTAFLDVQAGVDAALPGDEVWVAAAPTAYARVAELSSGVALYGGFAGTETERNQRDVKHNVTILDGNGKAPVVYVPPWNLQPSTVDGFTIRNGLGSGSYSTPMGGGIYCPGIATSLTISNNTITSNLATDGGGIYAGSYYVTITNNVISGNRAYGGGAGIYGGGLITHNAIIGNSADHGAGGVHGGQSIVNNIITGNNAGYGGGGGIYSSGRTTIVNNTITGNMARMIGAGVHADGDGVTIVNSIIAFNSSGIRLSVTPAKVTMRNNDVYGNTAGNYSGLPDQTGSDGNISKDPLFLSLATGNYCLQADSACIDTGDDSVVTVGDTDFAGRSRRQGAHVDMGAFEYNAAAAPYTVADAKNALAYGGGLDIPTSTNVSRLDAESDGPLTRSLDLRDCVRLARKAVGLDANP